MLDVSLLHARHVNTSASELFSKLEVMIFVYNKGKLLCGFIKYSSSKMCQNNELVLFLLNCALVLKASIKTHRSRSSLSLYETYIFMPEQHRVYHRIFMMIYNMKSEYCVFLSLVTCLLEQVPVPWLQRSTLVGYKH